MNDLLHQHCVPCEGGTQPLNETDENNYLSATAGWSINRTQVHQIEKNVVSTNFKAAVALINQIAELAEAEGHHPNLYLHNYKELKIELFTHNIGGLSVNDYIMAAKINEMLERAL